MLAGCLLLVSFDIVLVMSLSLPLNEINIFVKT